MSRISYIKTRELNKNSLYVIPNYNNYPKSKSLRTNELSLFQLNSSADYVYNFNGDVNKPNRLVTCNDFVIGEYPATALTINVDLITSDNNCDLVLRSGLDYKNYYFIPDNYPDNSDPTYFNEEYNDYLSDGVFKITGETNNDLITFNYNDGFIGLMSGNNVLNNDYNNYYSKIGFIPGGIIGSINGDNLPYNEDIIIINTKLLLNNNEGGGSFYVTDKDRINTYNLGSDASLYIKIPSEINGTPSFFSENYNFNTDRITMTKNGKILKIEGELIVNEIKFG